MIELGLFLAFLCAGKLLFSSPKELHGLGGFLIRLSNACNRLVPSDGNGSAEKTLDLRAAHGGTGHRICGMFSGERY